MRTEERKMSVWEKGEKTQDSMKEIYMSSWQLGYYMELGFKLN